MTTGFVVVLEEGLCESAVKFTVKIVTRIRRIREDFQDCLNYRFVGLHKCDFIALLVKEPLKVHRIVTLKVLLKVTLKVLLKVTLKVLKVTLKVCLFFSVFIILNDMLSESVNTLGFTGVSVASSILCI